VSELAQRLKPIFRSAGYRVNEDTLLKLTPLVQERLVVLDDALEKAGFFFEDEVHPAPDELIGKNMSPEESVNAAYEVYSLLSKLHSINQDVAESPLRELAEKLGIKVGQLFGIIRVAVTGQKISPPLFESMEIIGRDKVLNRIQNAIIILEEVEKRRAD
ncbi:MAG: hypothetical protein ACK2U3_04275, partial [Anaerolineales bacterium]